ncbi:MAG: exodeoxyribonuclease VII small subunit [Deltaproteobacteria bacterium]|jgi:exodeoxyribonuclease VII small subunit|nr:exodeoxyribonuclease VII small subunit [Deltaproteobacteria bacterium]
MTDPKTGKGPQPADPPQGTFEQDMERLKSLVSQLENHSLDLDRAISTFEEGVALSRSLSERLLKAEARLEEITRLADGGIKTTPAPPGSDWGAKPDGGGPGQGPAGKGGKAAPPPARGGPFVSGGGFPGGDDDDYEDPPAQGAPPRRGGGRGYVSEDAFDLEDDDDYEDEDEEYEDDEDGDEEDGEVDDDEEDEYDEYEDEEDDGDDDGGDGDGGGGDGGDGRGGR